MIQDLKKFYINYTLIFTYLERGVSLDSIKIKTRIEYLKVTKRAMSNGLAENMGLVGSRCWMELGGCRRR